MARPGLSENFDVVVVGGAVMGSSFAYHLAADARFSGRILVLDQDLAYSGAASALSLSSIRQQFSSPVNIRIGAASLKFLRAAPELLAVEGEKADIAFVERGYLYLASSAGETIMRDNHAVQMREGADIALLAPDALARRFPAFNLDGVALGSLGLSGEGWFDGYGLTQAFRRKAKSLGVEYRQGKVVGFDRANGRIDAVRLADGTRIGADAVLLAAGASGLAGLARALDAPLPVSSRKRCVYVFETPAQIPDCPLVIDTSGVYFRPEGAFFLAGVSPEEAGDPECYDFDVDWPLFDETIWPALAHRVPAFENLRVKRAWAGHYDLNTFDANAIVGRMGALANAYVAGGFSGHGIQQSPVIGRALAELVVAGRYETLDLSPLRYERVAEGRPLLERNVI